MEVVEQFCGRRPPDDEDAKKAKELEQIYDFPSLWH
jgi:hypothetical protein